MGSHSCYVCTPHCMQFFCCRCRSYNWFGKQREHRSCLMFFLELLRQLAFSLKQAMHGWRQPTGR